MLAEVAAGQPDARGGGHAKPRQAVGDEIDGTIGSFQAPTHEKSGRV